MQEPEEMRYTPLTVRELEACLERPNLEQQAAASAWAEADTVGDTRKRWVGRGKKRKDGEARISSEARSSQ